MKITINDKEITLKNTFRSMVAYEQIQGKMFSPQTFTDMIVYFYCVVISSTKDMDGFSFDQFLDWLDEHQEAMTDFSNWLRGIQEAEKEFGKKDEKKTTKTKAK